MGMEEVVKAEIGWEVLNMMKWRLIDCVSRCIFVDAHKGQESLVLSIDII